MSRGTLETYGTIMTVLGNNNYRVELSDGEATREVMCHLSGRMRRFRINIIPGDEVTVELPAPYDRGRITFRGKKADRPDKTGKQKKKSNPRRRNRRS